MDALREPELLKLKVWTPQITGLYSKSATCSLSRICYNYIGEYEPVYPLGGQIGNTHVCNDKVACGSFYKSALCHRDGEYLHPGTSHDIDGCQSLDFIEACSKHHEHSLAWRLSRCWNADTDFSHNLWVYHVCVNFAKDNCYPLDSAKLYIKILPCKRLLPK